MPHTTETLPAHERRCRDLKARLADVGDLRPGSLVERYRRCGKSGCHCAGRADPGHGPSWSLTRAVAGKTVTRVIPADAVARTREQLAEYRRFRGLVRELVEASEQVCDAQLASPAAAAAPEAAEKRGSRTRSPRRSSPRSTRS